MVADRSIDTARGYYLQGRHAEAESLYRQLLARQPNALGGCEGLGVLAFQQGRVDEALAFFSRCVAIDPGSARVHANLGNCSGRRSNFNRQPHTCTEPSKSMPQACKHGTVWGCYLWNWAKLTMPSKPIARQFV